MTQPASEPAWHPDPWKQAELRWHDGTSWTANTHGDAPQAAPSGQSAAAPVEAAAPPPLSVLHGMPHVPSTSGKAIGSFATGMIGIPIVPLVLGILALREISRSAGALTGRWMAIVGIVLCSLQLLLIPVILAVAIPTFLAQKDAAVRTNTIASVKQVVNAVETCAVSNPTGAYTGCDGTGAAEASPEVAPLLQRCGSPGGVCVTLAADGTGYEVTALDQEAPNTTYVERHGSDGSISKTCSGPSCPAGGRWG